MSDVDLVERLGDGIEELLYSHDSTGDVCRRLARAYPSARKVCIGDGYGMVYPADFIRQYHLPRTLLARSFARARVAVRRVASGPPLPPLRPDVAALVLPVDPSGRGLRGVELVCCTAEDFRAAIRHCHHRAEALRGYMHDTLQRYLGRRLYVLLTEPYVQAGFVRAEREAAMYLEIIRTNCESGSVVLVKPHPAEAGGVAERLRDVASGEFEIVATSRRFQRYPIEIWTELVRRCTVISAAYPQLSLKYAYGTDVVQPMDEAFISRWIEPGFRSWVRDGLRVYAEPLARLAQWDGSSILWSGGMGHG
ncbi:MAG: hypothetical protein AB7G08_28580 [Hyphomicrobiaceae bacterium]